MIIHSKKWQRPFLFAVLLSLPLLLTAQKLYSLDDCLTLALERNESLKIIRTDTEIADIQFKQSKGMFIPTLGVSNQHNVSIGRVLDPTTYNFVENRAVYDMNATLVGSVTLFSGLERYHDIGKARLNSISSQLSAQDVELKLKQNVMSLFFQILLDKKTISNCESKIRLLDRQEEQISKRIEFRAAVPADLLNVQADITNAKVEMTDAFGNLQSDMVSLCTLLDIADWNSFDVAMTEMDTSDTIVPNLLLSYSPDDIVSNVPSVRQSQVKSDIAKTDVKMASASYWPTLRLDAGMGTTYSNARYKTGEENYSLKEQFHDNMSSYLSMTVSVPVLSIVSTSRLVREKKLGYERSKIELEENRKAWTKEITQAAVLTQSAYTKYRLLSDDVLKFEEALQMVEEKYSLGAATYYDYQTAINNLYQARNKESQSAYEYLLRRKILELYRNH